MNIFYDESNNVNLIYYTDLPEELISLPHFSLDVLPEAEIVEGKESILKTDGSKVWYEYVDRELTEIDILNKKIELLASENETKDYLLQEIILQVYS